MTQSMHASFRPSQKELVTSSKHITESPQNSQAKDGHLNNDNSTSEAKLKKRPRANDSEKIINIEIRKEAREDGRKDGEPRNEYGDDIAGGSFLNNMPDGSSHFMQTSHTKSNDPNNHIANHHSIPNEISDCEEEHQHHAPPAPPQHPPPQPFLQNLSLLLDTSQLPPLPPPPAAASTSSLMHTILHQNLLRQIPQEETRRQPRPSTDLRAQTNGMQTVMSSVMNEFNRLSSQEEAESWREGPDGRREEEIPGGATKKEARDLCTSPAEPKTTVEMMTTVPQGATSPGQQAVIMKKIREAAQGQRLDDQGHNNNYDSTNTMKYGSFYYNSSPSSPSNLPPARTHPTLHNYYDDAIIQLHEEVPSLHRRRCAPYLPRPAAVEQTRQVTEKTKRGSGGNEEAEGDAVVGQMAQIRRATTTTQTFIQSNNHDNDPFSPDSNIQHTGGCGDMPSCSNLVSFGANGFPSATAGRSSQVIRQVSLQPSINTSSQRRAKESHLLQQSINESDNDGGHPADQQVIVEQLADHWKRQKEQGADWLRDGLQARNRQLMATGGELSGEGEVEAGMDCRQIHRQPQSSIFKIRSGMANRELESHGEYLLNNPQGALQDHPHGTTMDDPYISQQLPALKWQSEKPPNHGNGNWCSACTTVKKGGGNAYRVSARDHLDNSCITFQYYNSSKFASTSTQQEHPATAAHAFPSSSAMAPNCFYLTKTTTKSESHGYNSQLLDAPLPAHQHLPPFNPKSVIDATTAPNLEGDEEEQAAAQSSHLSPVDLCCQEIIMIEDGAGGMAGEEVWCGAGQVRWAGMDEGGQGPTNLQQDGGEGCEVIQERSSKDEQSKSASARSQHVSTTSNASSVVRVSINPSGGINCNNFYNQSLERVVISSGANNIECDYDMINFPDGHHPYSDLQPPPFGTSAHLPEPLSSSSTSHEDAWQQKATTSLDQLVLRKRMKTSEKLTSDNRLLVMSKKDKINLQMVGQGEAHGRNVAQALDQRPSSVLAPQSSKFVVNSDRQLEQLRAYCSLGSSPHKTPDSQDQSYTILQMASSAQKMGVSSSTFIPKQSIKSNGCDGSDGLPIPQAQTAYVNPDAPCDAHFIKPHAFSLSQDHSTEGDKPQNLQCDDDDLGGTDEQKQEPIGRNEQRPDLADIEIKEPEAVEPTHHLFEGLKGIAGVDSALLNSLFKNLNQLNALCSTNQDDQAQFKAVPRQLFVNNEQTDSASQPIASVPKPSSDLHSISDQNLQNRIKDFTKQVKEMSCRQEGQKDRETGEDEKAGIRKRSERHGQPRSSNLNSSLTRELEEFKSQERLVFEQQLDHLNHLASHPKSRQPPLLPHLLLPKHSHTLEDPSAGVRWGTGAALPARRCRNTTQRCLRTEECAAGDDEECILRAEDEKKIETGGRGRGNSWSRASGGGGSNSSRWQRQFRSSRSRSGVRSNGRSRRSSGAHVQPSQPVQADASKQLIVDLGGQVEARSQHLLQPDRSLPANSARNPVTGAALQHEKQQLGQSQWRSQARAPRTSNAIPQAPTTPLPLADADPRPVLSKRTSTSQNQQKSTAEPAALRVSIAKVHLLQNKQAHPRKKTSTKQQQAVGFGGLDSASYPRQLTQRGQQNNDDIDVHVEFMNRGLHHSSNDAGSFRQKRRSQVSQKSNKFHQSQELDRKKGKLKSKRDSLKSTEQPNTKPASRIPRITKQSKKENIDEENNTTRTRRRSGQMMQIRVNEYLQSGEKQTR